MFSKQGGSYSIRQVGDEDGAASPDRAKTTHAPVSSVLSNKSAVGLL